MEAQKVGIREFRENLATIVATAEKPVTITRHGDTIGVYFPVRRKRTEADEARYKEAFARLDAELERVGFHEEELNETLTELHEKRKQKRQ